MITETDILDIVVCPKSKQPLMYNPTKTELWSIESKCAYPIEDGIPILLPNESRPLSEEELAQLTQT